MKQHHSGVGENLEFLKYHRNIVRLEGEVKRQIRYKTINKGKQINARADTPNQLLIEK
jgi:hypothetical protein